MTPERRSGDGRLVLENQHILPEKQAAVSKIENRAMTVCVQANAIVIQDDDSAAEAIDFLNNVINPLIREGDELFDPMIESANRTHKLAIETKKKAVGLLPAAKLYIRQELGRWAQLVEDRARQERLRLEQEARNAEALRIEAEISAIEAAGGPDAEADIAAVLEAPRAELTLAPAAMALLANVPGARNSYLVEVINLREFFAAIGDGRVPTSLATANQAALNRRAAADKEGFNIPGCRLIKTKSVSSARRV